MKRLYFIAAVIILSIMTIMSVKTAECLIDNAKEKDYVGTVSYKTESLYVGLNMNDRTIPVQLDPNDYVRIKVDDPYVIRLSKEEAGEGYRIPTIDLWLLGFTIGLWVISLAVGAVKISNK